MKYCLIFIYQLVQLYANHFRWQVLCDRRRNTNKSEYISPCLAPLVHNADLSSFCRFYKLPASFLKKVRQFNSIIIVKFHKS